VSRGRRERRKAAESVPGPRRRSRAVALGVAADVALLVLGAGAWWWQSGRQSKAPPAGATQAALPAASFVGRQVCGQCHEQAEQRWRGSHHDLAMRLAIDASVAGDFDNARAIEAYYNLAVTPWLGVTVDLQVVDQSLNKTLESGPRLKDVDTAVVGGLRVYTRF